MKIYVASSWRNQHQPEVVRVLRAVGHEVYDFRNPLPGNNGFHWSEIDPTWQDWTPERYRHALGHPIARRGFARDYEGMCWADCCVLVLPSGRSAHLEAGWMAGRGKRTLIYCPEHVEPELMYLLCGPICVTICELLAELLRHQPATKILPPLPDGIPDTPEVRARLDRWTRKENERCL
jgi:hypothetical protein